MFNMIKDAINQKKDFQEAASLIYEDVSGNNLDDLIVLSEDAEPELLDNDFMESALYEGEGEEPEEPKENSGNGDNDDPDDRNDNSIPQEELDDTSILDEPIDSGSDDIMDQQMDDLPDIVGKQTGEPAIPSDDILDMQIDLHNNTPKDILPIPPAGASSAVGTDDDNDILSQNIDSGFGGEDNPDDNIMDEPVQSEEPETPEPESNKEPEEPENEEPESEEEPEEPENEEPKEESGMDLLSEAISLTGDGSGTDAPQTDQGGEGDSGSTEAPADDGSAGIQTDGDGSDTGEEPAAEENDVTTAVKDKVSEMDMSTDGEAGGTEGDTIILNKLSSLTKSIEDIKKSIINNKAVTG